MGDGGFRSTKRRASTGPPSSARPASRASGICSSPSRAPSPAPPRLIAETPQAVLNDYLLVRTLDNAAPYLSQNFVDAHFAFHGTMLNGTPQNEPRWKRGVSLVTARDPRRSQPDLRPALFPAGDQARRRRARPQHHRRDGRAAASISPGWRPRRASAPAPSSRAFTPKIGYPSCWRDYSSVRISRTDLVQNILNARDLGLGFQPQQARPPVDRREWGMTPMKINAYANPAWNEIVFPAAILQPPFFDPNADHGGQLWRHRRGDRPRDEPPFRRSGQPATTSMARSTNGGRRRTVARFNALTAQLVAEYDAYEPLPGHHVQGALTLGENIADLAGLTVAYDAYHRALNGRPAPVIDGFTGDQRFYLGWAQVWRRKYREANLLQRLLTDPHSPSEQRAAVVRNLDPWYAAFTSRARPAALSAARAAGAHLVGMASAASFAAGGRPRRAGSICRSSCSASPRRVGGPAALGDPRARSSPPPSSPGWSASGGLLLLVRRGPAADAAAGRAAAPDLALLRDALDSAGPAQAVGALRSRRRAWSARAAPGRTGSAPIRCRSRSSASPRPRAATAPSPSRASPSAARPSRARSGSPASATATCSGGSGAPTRTTSPGRRGA